MVLLYSTIGALVKISVVSFYLRLSPQRNFVWVCRSTIIFIALTYIGTLPVLIAPCKPFRASWDFTLQFLPTTKCIDTAALYSAHAVIYCVLDFVVMLLPMPMLVRLQLPIIQKVQAMLVFMCTGMYDPPPTSSPLTNTLSVGMAGIFRCYWIVAGPSYGMDQNWAATHAMIWSTIEISLGIVCACLPAVKGLLARLFPRVFGPMYGSKKTVIFAGGQNNYQASSSAIKREQVRRPEDVAGNDVILKSIQFKVHVEGDDESTNDLLAGVRRVATGGESRGSEK